MERSAAFLFSESNDDVAASRACCYITRNCYHILGSARMLQCHKELSLYLGSARTLHTLAAHFKSATVILSAAVVSLELNAQDRLRSRQRSCRPNAAHLLDVDIIGSSRARECVASVALRRDTYISMRVSTVIVLRCVVAARHSPHIRGGSRGRLSSSF